MRELRPAIALLLGTSLVFFGVTRAGALLDDHALSRSVSLGELFGASGYWRPLFSLSFAFDRALFGPPGPGWHLHSLLWHLAAVLLLWSWLGRRGLAPGPRFGAAALYALHPVQVEAVAWLSARNDPMATSFALLALHLLDRPAFAAAAWGLALLSKESALLLPLLMLAWCDKRLQMALSVGVVGVSWLAARLLVGVSAPEAELGLLPGVLPEVLGSVVYRIVAFFPYFSWHIDGMPLTRGAGLGWTALGLVGIALARPWLGAAALLWAPALYAVAAYGLVADRYLHLPLAIAAGALGALPDRPATRLGLGLLVLGAGAASWSRVGAWESEARLFAADRALRPNCYNGVQLAMSSPDPTEARAAATEEAGPGCDRAWAPAIRGALRAQDRAAALRLVDASEGAEAPGLRCARAWTLVATGDWAAATRLVARPADACEAAVWAADAERRGEAAPYPADPADVALLRSLAP